MEPESWDDGRGPARGVLIRLPSGRIALLKELAYAIKYHGWPGPELVVDGADLVGFGISSLIEEAPARWAFPRVQLHGKQINLKDFPTDVLDTYGIHTRHPDDFILDIDGISRGSLIDAARRDFEHDCDPPLTVDNYIQGLRITKIPKTADYLHKLRVLLTS
jgi:hypothetical protein